MTTADILARFPNLRALVVGDICLDRWCTYEPSAKEPSAETGLDRVAVVATGITPGAGGTVANNLAALGCGRVAVLGAAGRDGHGWELREALKMRGIDDELLIAAAGMQTFTYTKFWNASTGEEDLPRADFVNLKPLPPAIEHRICVSLREEAHAFDVILVSDQAETETGGTVTKRVRDVLAELAAGNAAQVIWVDSRKRAEHFRGVTVKVNTREAEEASLRALGRVDFEALRRVIGSRPLIVTRGPDGADVHDDTGRSSVAGKPKSSPIDICGAGDSFSAAAALALAVTGSAAEASRIGNLAASVTVMKRGTGTASQEEVLEAERV